MQIKTPDWVKHAVFYQIFPDRFARTTHTDLPPEMQVPFDPWESPPTRHGYKGGALWGVAEQLDYLQDLGSTAIYFTPIFQAASNHRYHTHDYYKVDPVLGGNEAFFELLHAAHDRDMKVVLDGVFNHASRGFFYFNDLLENGEKSPWKDWFRVEKGSDGWRRDVPGEVTTPGFWAEFRSRIKAINPEAYIVGEIWEDASAWLQGDQFDGVMNYPFTGAAIAFTAKNKVNLPLAEGPAYYPYPALDAKGYAEKIDELLNRHDWEIQQTQLNLLSSHDIARVLSLVDGDISSMQLAMMLLMTFPGAPSIYYGDEVGLFGGIDPDCRRGFPTEENWNRPFLDMHKALIALRRSHPALRTGKYQTLAAEGDCYVFARLLDREMIVVAVNTGMASVQARLADIAVENGKVLYGEGEVEWLGDRTAMLTLPARSGMVLGNA